MKVFLKIVVLTLLGFNLKAQVINIEGKRFLKDSNGFIGRADVNFNINQNTQQVLYFGTNIHMQYRKNKYRLLTITDFSFIKAGRQDFVNAGYQHIRYNYKLTKLITWEVFTQAQYNRILLLDRRYLAGTGPRFRVLKKEKVKVYAAALYMYEYQSQNNDSIHAFNNRVSAYVTLSIGFNKIDFTSTTFYQPKLGDLNNYRIANDSSLDVAITKRFNFKTGFNLLYDTRQPIGIPALTYALKNGLSYRF